MLYFGLPIKIVKFTDSHYRDFEFYFRISIVEVCYLIDDKHRGDYGARASTAVSFVDAENNNFPKSLYDFPEAKDYIRRYLNNIAFT